MNIARRQPITAHAVLCEIENSSHGWLSAAQLTEALNDSPDGVSMPQLAHEKILTIARSLVDSGLLVEATLRAQHDGETVTLTAHYGGTEAVFQLP